MDFIIGLPKIQSNFDNNMVVVDRLTKIAHSILMITTITAYGVAELFKTYIFRQYGFPCEIINDRDRKFVSGFWTTLFKLCGIKIKLSTAYHVGIDGQT